MRRVDPLLNSQKGVVTEGKPLPPDSNAPSNGLVDYAGVFCWSVVFCLGRFKAMGYADKYPISSYQPDSQVVMA